MKKGILFIICIVALNLNTQGQNTVGRTAPCTGAIIGFGVGSYGPVFTVTTAINLNCVAFYPYSSGSNVSGTVEIGLFYATVSGSTVTLGSLAASTTALIVANPTPVSQIVSLNFSIPPGTYLLTPMAYSTGITSAFFDDTCTSAFPYTAPGISIIGGTFNHIFSSKIYYYFYNWSLGSNCVSDVNYVTDENIISVFPSPSDGKFILKNNRSIKSIIVYNTIGEAVMEKRPVAGSDNKVEIDLSRQLDGIYFLQINDGQKLVGRKIIVSHH